jgi:phosphatidylglycerol---prolipoprotein diacylglyceryl transferase
MTGAARTQEWGTRMSSVREVGLDLDPTVGTIAGIPVGTHGLFVGLGVLVAAAVFMAEARRRGQTDERILYVVLGALVGGAVFMRLGTWMQHVDLRQNASLAEQWLYGNRSILGGLVGAWLGVHVAKRMVGYRLRTGDLFAPAVALGMAVGRVGCLLTELPGTATGSSFGIVLDPVAAARVDAAPGVALHPSFLYEIVFHAAAFTVLWFYLRYRLSAPGETLTLYLVGYGVFRFLVEFVRGNEVVWAGLTRPQLFLLATVPLLLARVLWQARKGLYRLAPAEATT